MFNFHSILIILIVLFSTINLASSHSCEGEVESYYTNVKEGLAARKIWSHNLYEELTKIYDKANKNWQSEPGSHSRFDVIGPIGPICNQLNKFGAGDGEN